MKKYLSKFAQNLITICMISCSCTANAACVITGCNNEICSDSIQPHFGICQWKEQYQCYHEYGVCAEDENGNCAWSNTPQLQQCLTNLQQETQGSTYMPQTAVE